jgi:hypothetical protein
MTILSDQDQLASRFDQELPEAEIVTSLRRRDAA